MKTPWWPHVRDVILFFAGLAGVAVETFKADTDPQLLILFAGMMGLPLVIRKDGS